MLDKPRGPEAPSQALLPAAMPLGKFLRRTGATLRARWPSCLWVACAVTAAKPIKQGFVLELIDPGPGGQEEGQLRAFLPSGTLATLRAEAGRSFSPAHLVGMSVLLQLEPRFHVRWHFQAEVVGIAEGIGESLSAKVKGAAREALVAEGLYDRQRRLDRPADVTRVGLVHPHGAAGFGDVEAELARWRSGGLVATRSVVAPFEGVGAPAKIAAAIAAASLPISGAPPDVILVVRGGGGKAALQTLDDDRLARAIASCPIPIVIGVGHAGDRSLADEVAFRSLDTPSKAIAFIRDMIVERGRAAVEHGLAIRRRAEARIERGDANLGAISGRCAAAAEARLTAASAALADTWAEVRATARGARERCLRLSDGAERGLDDVAEAAAAHLASASRAATSRLDVLVGQARHRLARTDQGRDLVIGIQARASAMVGEETAALDALADAVARAAGRHIEQAETILDRLNDLFGVLDPFAVLDRGYAIVADGDGRILTDAASAASVGRLAIIFFDGSLAVKVEPKPKSGATP